jgi:uncharacterized protein YbcI
MKPSFANIGQKIARAAQAFEKRRTKQGRNWVAVFLNEKTIVIALHGDLTAAEKARAQSFAGAAQVQEFHRQLFANTSGGLRQQIQSITGMEVCDTWAEIEPATGSVVQFFTTDTKGEDFPRARSGPVRTEARVHRPHRGSEMSTRREANRSRMCNPETIARVLF